MAAWRATTGPLMSALSRYEASGKFSASLGLWLPAAMLAGALGAGVYELAMFYVSWIYVLFVFVLAFAIALAALAQTHLLGQL